MIEVKVHNNNKFDCLHISPAGPGPGVPQHNKQLILKRAAVCFVSSPAK